MELFFFSLRISLRRIFAFKSKAFSTPLWEGFSPCEIFFENFARRVKKNILKKIFFQKKTDRHDRSWLRLSQQPRFLFQRNFLYHYGQKTIDQKRRPINPLGFMEGG